MVNDLFVRLIRMIGIRIAGSYFQSVRLSGYQIPRYHCSVSLYNSSAIKTTCRRISKLCEAKVLFPRHVGLSMFNTAKAAFVKFKNVLGTQILASLQSGTKVFRYNLKSKDADLVWTERGFVHWPYNLSERWCLL